MNPPYVHCVPGASCVKHTAHMHNSKSAMTLVAAAEVMDDELRQHAAVKQNPHCCTVMDSFARTRCASGLSPYR